MVEKGYTWMTLDQAAYLYGLLGAAAYKVPPHADLAVLPEYVDGDVQAMARMIENIESGRTSGK